MNSTEKNYHFN